MKIKHLLRKRTAFGNVFSFLHVKTEKNRIAVNTLTMTEKNAWQMCK